MDTILRRLRESRMTEDADNGYYVIDNTSIDKDGDSSKYYVADMEEARLKIRDLINQGSDIDEIHISKIVKESNEKDEDLDEDESYSEFVAACTSNPTWKKANAICEKYGYMFSDTSCVDVYPSGKKIPDVNIRVDHSKRYNPEIYYYSGKFGKSEPSIEIQTTAYGSLELEQHAEFLEAVTNAHKMVEELSKLDFTTLYEAPVE